MSARFVFFEFPIDPFYTRENQTELSDVIGVANWKHQAHRLILFHLF